MATITFDTTIPAHVQNIARTDTTFSGNKTCSSTGSPFTYNWKVLAPQITVEKQVLVSGESPPNWSEVIGKGILPPTEYHVRTARFTHTVRDCDSTRCLLSMSNSRNSMKYSGHSGGLTKIVIPELPVPPAVDLDMLLQEAHGKARDAGLMLMVELAESRKSLALVLGFRQNLMKRANHIANVVRRRQRQRAKSPSRRAREKGGIPSFSAAVYSEFLSAWMESRYGWNQFVYSAEDLRLGLERWNGNREARYAVGSAKAADLVTSPTASTNTYEWKAYANQTEVLANSGSASITGRARVTAHVKRDDLNGVISINPLTTAWELVPYSWVLDWAVNVKDILAAHWPSSSFEGVAATVSTKTTRSHKVEYRHKSYSYPERSIPTVGNQPNVAEYKVEEYHRVPRTDVPIVLGFRDNFSRKKAIDALALIDGAVRKTLRGQRTRLRV